MNRAQRIGSSPSPRSTAVINHHTSNEDGASVAGGGGVADVLGLGGTLARLPTAAAAAGGYGAMPAVATGTLKGAPLAPIYTPNHTMMANGKDAADGFPATNGTIRGAGGGVVLRGTIRPGSDHKGVGGGGAALGTLGKRAFPLANNNTGGGGGAISGGSSLPNPPMILQRTLQRQKQKHIQQQMELMMQQQQQRDEEGLQHYDDDGDGEAESTVPPALRGGRRGILRGKLRETLAEAEHLKEVERPLSGGGTTRVNSSVHHSHIAPTPLDRTAAPSPMSSYGGNSNTFISQHNGRAIPVVSIVGSSANNKSANSSGSGANSRTNTIRKQQSRQKEDSPLDEDRGADDTNEEDDGDDGDGVIMSSAGLSTLGSVKVIEHSTDTVNGGEGEAKLVREGSASSDSSPSALRNPSPPPPSTTRSSSVNADGAFNRYRQRGGGGGGSDDDDDGKVATSTLHDVPIAAPAAAEGAAGGSIRGTINNLRLAPNDLAAKGHHGHRTAATNLQARVIKAASGQSITPDSATISGDGKRHSLTNNKSSGGGGMDDAASAAAAFGVGGVATPSSGATGTDIAAQSGSMIAESTSTAITPTPRSTVNFTPAALSGGATPSRGASAGASRGGSATSGRHRPRSARQDYEKYVRGITGGAYLKERYSDHIKVSTHMVLGRGSYGIVYSGVNEKTGQMVAVKHIEIDAKREVWSGHTFDTGAGSDDPADGASSTPKPKSRPISASPSHKEILRASQVDECLKDVVTEIRLMAQLKHPNIVQYYHAEIVGPRWEEIHDRRHQYLTQQRRRVQRHERRLTMAANGGMDPMSPLSPLLQKEDNEKVLPPLEPPHPDLTTPPSPNGRRYLVIYMEFMSGGSLGSLMTKIVGDKLARAREAIVAQRAREQEELRRKEAAEAAAKGVAAPPVKKGEKPAPIVIPPRVIGFTEAMVRVYFRQVLEGLAYLHDHNIVHRDIKADNLLLSASDGVVRISDFGTSRKFSDVSALGCTSGDGDGGEGGQRALMTVIGTPHFMAPEVITKAGHGFPADIWSIGVTVIQLLTGQAPYESGGGNEFSIMFKIAKEPEKIQEFIPSDASIMAKDFIVKCVAPEPEDRWTARQLLSHPFLLEDPDGYYSSSDEESDEEGEGDDDEYEVV